MAAEPSGDVVSSATGDHYSPSIRGMVLAQKDDDDLLVPMKKAKPEKKEPADDDLLLPAKTDKPAKDDRTEQGIDLKGFIQGEAAYAFRDPEHWSKAKGILELGSNGRLGESAKWKVSARAYYDAVFDIEKNFYAPAVKDDQRHEFQWRETYLDIPAGEWEFRLGRQHVIWGEMIALFFADVVSARDLREFILPDFDMLRIPQWAARAEYFKDDFHAELLWVPYVTVDNVGKPFDASGKSGAEFYMYPPQTSGVPGYAIADLEKPTHKLSNTNVGLRVSGLTSGWDLSAFYYHSVDIQPTFYRTIIAAPVAPVPTALFTPRHDKIDQIGGTLSKDFSDFLLKGEAVFTHGRKFNVTRLSQDDGLVASNTFDWIAGLEFTPFADGRFNVQLFQRYYASHDPDMIPDRTESGVTLLLSGKPRRNVEVQGLLISSLNRSDWLFRPKLTWNLEKNWRWVFGVDVFHGPTTGLFGQYDDKDRVYTELRYSF